MTIVHTPPAAAQLPDKPEIQDEDYSGGVGETIEERCFSAALICLEGHFTELPPMGPQTAARVNSMITKTLEKTHTIRKAR